MQLLPIHFRRVAVQLRPIPTPDRAQLHCDLPYLEGLMAQGYQYLEAAAREIVAPEK